MIRLREVLTEQLTRNLDRHRVVVWADPHGEYLGLDRKFDTRVTIDVFASNESIMPGGLTVSAWEARVLGKLGDHPNIAIVVDHWEDDQAAIMVSRYLSGGNLLDLIARSRESGEGLPVERILEIATEIAHGLAYIHGRRILYLDLQPRNVLFDERGTVHLVDFDAAVPLDQPDVSHLADRPVIVYTAPEVTDGGGADERADLYSLGATIYEIAAGRPPFAGSREEILAARRAGPPPPLDREDLPHTLRDLVFSLLSADREQRPASAAEIIERLDGISTARAAIERLLTSDESARLEFKSSLRVPLGPPPPGSKRRRKRSSETLSLRFSRRWRPFSTPTAAPSLLAWQMTGRSWASRSISRGSGNYVMAGAEHSTTSSPAILEPRC